MEQYKSTKYYYKKRTPQWRPWGSEQRVAVFDSTIPVKTGGDAEFGMRHVTSFTICYRDHKWPNPTNLQKDLEARLAKVIIKLEAPPEKLEPTYTQTEVDEALVKAGYQVPGESFVD